MTPIAERVLVQETSIPARDGFPLAATVITPLSMPRAAVLISSATAVPRKIYRAFATFLADRGFTCLTYDYRGTGGSRPASLRGFQARMRDWALLDAAGAIAHMRRVWPALPLMMVGHSFGGHALGLAPNNDQIARALIVASQAGSWRFIAFPERYRVYLMARMAGPLLARACGFMPRWSGLGEDLPRDVFLEWSRWIGLRRSFFDDPSLDANNTFARFEGRLRAIGLDDDPWATGEAIDVFVAAFRGTRAERMQIHPRDIGARRIGHFGFFRPANATPLWHDAAAWLAAP